MKWLLTITICILLAISANAQVQPQKMITLGVVMQSYKGDLSESYNGYSAAFQGSLLFNKKEKWNGGVNLTIGNINGQQLSGIPVSASQQPNTYFKTSVVSVHYDVRYNFLVREHWKVYVSLGFGLMRFNPKDQDDNNLQDLIDTRGFNESYGNITAMIPFQAGFMYFLNNGYGLNFQTGFLNIFTDYIDNISELGNQSGGDNILQFQFSFIAPIQ